MTQDQFARLKSELETSFQGAAHGSFDCRLRDGPAFAARRRLGLEAAFSFCRLRDGRMTPKDMDFIEAKNSAAREIALAIGVPPMLLGMAQLFVASAMGRCNVFQLCRSPSGVLETSLASGEQA